MGRGLCPLVPVRHEGKGPTNFRKFRQRAVTLATEEDPVTEAEKALDSFESATRSMRRRWSWNNKRW